MTAACIDPRHSTQPPIVALRAALRVANDFGTVFSSFTCMLVFLLGTGCLISNTRMPAVTDTTDLCNIHDSSTEIREDVEEIGLGAVVSQRIIKEVSQSECIIFSTHVNNCEGRLL